MSTIIRQKLTGKKPFLPGWIPPWLLIRHEGNHYLHTWDSPKDQPGAGDFEQESGGTSLAYVDQDSDGTIVWIHPDVAGKFAKERDSVSEEYDLPVRLVVDSGMPVWEESSQ